MPSPVMSDVPLFNMHFPGFYRFRMGKINDACRKLHELLVLLEDIENEVEPSTIEQHLARKGKAQKPLSEWMDIIEPIAKIVDAQTAFRIVTIRREGMDAAQTEYYRVDQCCTMVKHLGREIERLRISEIAINP